MFYFCLFWIGEGGGCRFYCGLLELSVNFFSLSIANKVKIEKPILCKKEKKKKNTIKCLPMHVL